MAPSMSYTMRADNQSAPHDCVSEISAKVTVESAIKALIYDTGHHNAKPVKALAAEVGIPLKRFYAAIDPRNDQPFPVEKLVPLMQATGNYTVLLRMTDECGFTASQTPKLESAADVMACIAHVAKETGEVFSTMSVAIADGCVCADDARRMLAEVEDALRCVHGLRAALRARVEAGR